MKRTVIIFTILSIIAKIIAFGRELVLSYCYGASETSDIFLLSITLPVTIFGFISTGIISGFIPIYQKVFNEKGKSAAEDFSSKITTIVVAISIALVGCYYIFSEWILKLLASGFTDDALVKARSFTDISIWTIPITAIVTVLTGYLQINNQVRFTALVSVPLNVGIMITIVISYLNGNLLVLPYGFLLSSALQVGYLLILAVKNGYRYKLTLGIKDEYVRFFLSSLGMLIISGSISQINILVDRTLATQVVEGGFSLFEYGSRINDFLMGMTIIPISTAMFPAMSQNADNRETLSQQVEEGITLFTVVMIPLMVFVCAFSQPIVDLIYRRGAFDEIAAAHTVSIVFFYGIGLFAFALRELISKAFYAMGDARTPMINAAIALTINIFLNFILMRIMGLGGLALATSISAYVTILMLYRPLSNYVSGINVRNILFYVMKTALIAGICVIAAIKVYMITSNTNIDISISFLVATFIFTGLYGVFAILAGLVRIDRIKSIIRKK